jgi:FtsP/CotA-like multicopper oxidase with cupredoxin domain
MVQKRSVMGGTFRLAFALALAAAIPAAAIDCPPQGTEPPLKEPPVIEATCNGQPCQPGQPGAIDTTFRLEIHEQCVPESASKSLKLKLRTYVYPDPKNPGKEIYGFPGPTLKLRKAFTSKPNDRGDTLAILLDNRLPADSIGCNSACPATVTCPDRSKLPPPSSCGDLCCCWINANQELPDCMHGDNTTNLHLHGSHISPQSPQDYVLLELHPAAGKGKELHRMAARSNLQVGTFQYKTDPFPFNQSEGTHWYHPHKHGSVSLQVANGMAGALIILGPFDEWLNDYYAKRGTKLTEKILILQQIQQDTNLFGKGGAGRRRF